MRAALLVVVVVGLAGVEARDISVTATISDAPTSRKISNMHPAVTLDWWVHDDPKYGFQWGNASILVLNLSHPFLIDLATGLNGSALRLGGSPLDSIEYDFDGTCKRGRGSAGGAGGFSCSQTGEWTYGCFTPSRWQEFLAFSKATGLRMLFGLNACNGRPSSDDAMDFSNIDRFLNFTASLPSSSLEGLVGFEFSNEIIPHGVSAKRWSTDANELRQKITASLGSAQWLVGPDTGGMFPMPDMRPYLGADTLNAVTYHDYPQCEPAFDEGFVLSPSCLDKLDEQAETGGQYGQLYNPRAEVWLGEGAEHTATGADFGRDFLPTFISSFYYTWVTAALPLKNVTLHARQCLIGGNYGLLNRTTFKPQPDYFIAWTYRNLFRNHLTGDVYPLAVNASMSSSEGTRTFAFAGEDKTKRLIVSLNLCTQNTVKVDLPQLHQASGRKVWLYTGYPNTSASNVAVNGSPISYSGSLPDFVSLAKSQSAADAITLPPESIAFVLYEGVQN